MLDELRLHRLDVQPHGQGRKHFGAASSALGAAYSVPRRIRQPINTLTSNATTNEAARLSFMISSASCIVSAARPLVWLYWRFAILLKELVRSRR